jgi:predicted signal transduction protein with EAL and GGDEF domain
MNGAQPPGDGAEDDSLLLDPREALRGREVLMAQVAASCRNAGLLTLFHVELLDLHELSDTFGEDAGRKVLLRSRERLMALAGDQGTCERLADSRFAAMIPGLLNAEQVRRMAARICRELTLPVATAGRQVMPAVAVGAALASPGERAARIDPADLMKHADAALLEARREGAGMHRLYSEDIDDRIRNRTLLRHALQQAIAGRQFQICFQPIVDLNEHRVIGAEALLRWSHAELGTVPPSGFIPMAEESGLIVPLGAQALELALHQARRWHESGQLPARVAVNVSGVQLRRPGFVETVARALAVTDSYPEWLELELTEGTLIDSTADTVRALRTIAAMGVTLSVDDFGTGYSSLRILRDLPVHKLKIDQSFVRDMATNPRDALIVGAIIALTRSLGLQSVAEGVETQAQSEMLRDAGCMAGQGFLFQPPVPAAEFGRIGKRPG